MTGLQSSKNVSLQAFDRPSMEPVSAREVLLRLWTHRRLLATSTLIAGVLAAAISLALPTQYTARATILPDAQGNVSAAGLSQLAASFGFALGRASNGLTELYPTMLTSDRILAPVMYQRLQTRNGDLQSLVQFWDLDTVDSARAYERALRRLRDKTLTVGADRRTLVVSIGVTLRDPSFAANVVNAMVAQMDSFVRQFQRAQAADRVRWIETRLTQVLADLERSERTLKDFRVRNRLIASSPQLQLQEQQFMREVETNSAIYVELKRQLEIAKIDEVKNIPVVQVLDYARPPVRKSYPPRTAIVLGTMIIAWLAVGAVVIGRQPDPTATYKDALGLLRKLRADLASDFRRFTRRGRT
jgi:uncharacterized protein involved in exopolysaccharide biosynthesis